MKKLERRVRCVDVTLGDLMETVTFHFTEPSEHTESKVLRTQLTFPTVTDGKKVFTNGTFNQTFTRKVIVTACDAYYKGTAKAVAAYYAASLNAAKAFLNDPLNPSKVIHAVLDKCLGVAAYDDTKNLDEARYMADSILAVISSFKS